MDLQTLLEQRNISKYQLSKISGVPKTTIMIFAPGEANVERCSAKTVRQIATALNCTMEELMELSAPSYDEAGHNGPQLPECGLPEFLQNRSKLWSARGRSWIAARNIRYGIAIIAICKVTSTAQRSIRLSAQSRHGICAKNI